jgi:diguanylate cyclase (GGDEF)-like protein
MNINRPSSLRPSTVWIIVAVIVMVIAVSIVDYSTGVRWSELPLYLIPVLVSAWLLGRRLTLAICLVVGVGWFIARRSAGDIDEPLSSSIQGAIARVAVFLVVAWLATALRDALGRTRHILQADLTSGLHNRPGFMHSSTVAIANAKEVNGPTTLILIDIDELSEVNRTCGQQRGDLVVALTGRSCAEAARARDVVARTGSDEFSLLLVNTPGDQVEQLLNRLRANLARITGMVGVAVTHTIVVCQSQRPPLAIEDLIMFAEVELRNLPSRPGEVVRVEYHDATMARRAS